MPSSLIRVSARRTLVYAPRVRPFVARRNIFGLFNKKQPPAKKPEPVPILAPDDLFHPLSKSPFPEVRARAEVIQKLAPCPVCLEEHNHGEHSAEAAEGEAPAKPKSVAFECPDCGWPTHCSEEHWKADTEHVKYCSRLRDANEDEHDLRSQRRFREFEMPGPQGYEDAISFANWDTFWYTRGFFSMDSERSRRHASKVLSYPITIGNVLHQYSNLTLNNQRLTPEGSRSMAAIRSTLHVPTGTPETPEHAAGKPQVRVFILGARGESSLPVHVWEQLTMLFPSSNLHIIFIGPQVALPKGFGKKKQTTHQATSSDPSPKSTSTASASSTTSSPAPEPEAAPQTEATSESTAVTESEEELEEERPIYSPNVYMPKTPKPIPAQPYTRNAIQKYGAPSYTTPYTHALTVTGIRSSYTPDLHNEHFADTLDPYSDCFFLFSPGLGFPSPTAPSAADKVLQINSPTEWGGVLPTLLETKCPIFVTGFSPADLERDVRALATSEIANDFDWILTPGPNEFASLRWEVADFDPRVMIKLNYGIWGIRGKTREIQEKSSIFDVFAPRV
ncbi:zinc-finger of mitochondrial splicing suppressor 51-domain-containing protein [Schizophyllum commune]